MTNESNDVAIIILAAGLGTRMKSDKAKVLHELNGRPMISYVVTTAKAVAGDNLVLVIGHQADRVREVVTQQTDARFAIQKEQLGTGHAVISAMPELPASADHVVILYGDVPMLKGETLERFIEEHRSNARILSVLAVHLDNPTGYGRIVQENNGSVKAIVEESDATTEQKGIKLVNTGIYAVDRRFLTRALQDIKAENAQGEYYLTDIVSVANKENVAVGVTIETDANEFVGINSPAQLEAVERMMSNG